MMLLLLLLMMIFYCCCESVNAGLCFSIVSIRWVKDFEKKIYIVSSLSHYMSYMY